MIVRIFTEGQYSVPESEADHVKELDAAFIAAADAGDEERFHATLKELIGLVRSAGEQLPDDDLSQSEMMLPPADTSLEEAKREFTGEGLIPD